MTPEDERHHTPWGWVHVSETEHGDLTILRRGSLDGVGGVAMARYDVDSGMIRLFPRQGEATGSSDAYKQLKEIRLDRVVTSFDPHNPIGPTPNEDLFLKGLPDGVGVVLSHGLRFPRPYGRLVAEIEAQTPCSVLHIGQVTTHIDGLVLHLAIQEFRAYIATVNRHLSRANDIARDLNAAEAFNSIARASGRSPQRPRVRTSQAKRQMQAVIVGASALDDDGRNELIALAAAEVPAAARTNSNALGRLRADVDLITLEVLIERCEDALNSGSAKSEATAALFP